MNQSWPSRRALGKSRPVLSAESEERALAEAPQDGVGSSQPT